MSDDSRVILLVDPPEELLSDLAAGSQPPDVEWLTAPNGRDALSLASREPTLAIIERDLEDTDGYLLSRKIASTSPRTTIFLITPTDDPEEVKAARDVGAEGVLVPPLAVETILRLLEEVGRSRRKHCRVQAQIEIDYCAGDDVFLEKSLNLSLGGLFVRTNKPLEIGTTVDLSFTVPGLDHKIDAAGEVSWRQDFDPDGPIDQIAGMGIEFSGLKPEDSRALSDFLKNRLRELETPDAD